MDEKKSDEGMQEGSKPEEGLNPPLEERFEKLRSDIRKEQEEKLHRVWPNRPADKQPVPFKCDCCGNKFRLGSFRYKRNHRNYCTRDCYYKAVSPNRVRVPVVHGSSRKARKIIDTFFTLLPEHVVHFIDQNAANYDIRNLMVFRNRMEFTRWYRYKDERENIKPLFDGSQLRSLLDDKKPKSGWNLSFAV
ncbi:MAG: hypothetical protein JW768_11195 [Chitinispirillaceae bacterium]|nr:hypothetical protein [Chitinispirillaceae bacterium]